MNRLALVVGLVVAALGAESARGGENLLRNGSFEGGLLYWHGLEPKHQYLVTENAKHGGSALRIEKGFVMSAPFVAERGESYTASFWVKGDRPGHFDVQMPPSAREVGTASKRLWMTEATQAAKIGTEWQRVSFTWKADVPTDGFWPQPHYLLSFGAGDSTPVLVDGVTVTRGTKWSDDYLPYRALEVVAECLDWPGYAGAKANLLERGATVRIVGHVFNPHREPKQAKLRWQLFDYEGETPVGEAIEKSLELKGLETKSLTVPLKLSHVGCVLARVSIVVDGKVIDSSELPLTTLPYPKAATKLDPRERFGGSFAGGLGCVEKFQRIGFGWIRWRPQGNGENHLPVEPKSGEPWKWTWCDKELDEQEAHGCSAHLVLYPPPKWIMEPGHPLPKDMRWKADDPRWEDLSVETVWDKFVKQAVAHYEHRALVFEIENEPEFDHWLDHKLGDEYARFTLRTARLIKQVDAKARVMVNNVYGIPSSLNSRLFALKDWHLAIDVVSWHDYHAGRLTDAQGIRRMRQNMDEAGGKAVELWFNEGWAFTNTAVDEPIACTALTSAQSTTAMMACVAEMSVAGQHKTILFHTAYEDHGMSFWDYSGPGTQLWDWYNYPLPLVASWNVLAHHIGVSEAAGFVRPVGANFAIFQDLRNQRGVIVAYADEGSKQDVPLQLPAAMGSLVVEDIMGNAAPLANRSLTLSKTGRLVYLYSESKTPAAQFLAALEPLDRKHASFVSTGGTAGRSWRLPATWDGKTKGSDEGSIAIADGKPIWKLEQLWPADPKARENFRPMFWTGVEWNVKEGGFGGQPGAALKDGVLTLGTRAAHGTPMHPRIAGLTFIAPQAGNYVLRGTADSRIWDGKNTTQLVLYRKTAKGVSKVASRAIAHEGKVSLDDLAVELEAGDELVLLPQIEGAYAGGNLNLRELSISLGEKGKVVEGYRLPAVWEGKEKNGTAGNPIEVSGRPIWRLDQLLPRADRILPASYRPLVWNGTQWNVLEGGQGGQPGVDVADGKFKLGMSGPWNGPGVEHEKTAALVFIPPAAGRFRVQATVSAKKWTGGAKSYLLEVSKRDTQRVSELKSFTLPSDGTPVIVEMEVELAGGHELVFLPRCPDYNNGTNCTMEGLVITPVR